MGSVHGPVLEPRRGVAHYIAQDIGVGVRPLDGNADLADKVRGMVLHHVQAPSIGPVSSDPNQRHCPDLEFPHGRIRGDRFSGRRCRTVRCGTVGKEGVKTASFTRSGEERSSSSSIFQSILGCALWEKSAVGTAVHGSSASGLRHLCTNPTARCYSRPGGPRNQRFNRAQGFPPQAFFGQRHNPTFHTNPKEVSLKLTP